MADLSWETVRDQMDIEQHLINIPADSITLEDTQQILMRMRVFCDVRRNNSDLVPQILQRFLALRAKSRNISATQMLQITDAMRLTRTNTFRQSPVYIAIQNQGPWPAVLPQDNIQSWENFSNWMLVQQDRSVLDVNMGHMMATETSKYEYLDIQGLSHDEPQTIHQIVCGLEEDIRDNIANGALTADEVAQLGPLLQIITDAPEVPLQRVSNAYGWHNAIASPPPVEEARSAAIPSLFPAVDLETILSLFPAVDLESLPLDHRTYGICLEEHGSAESGDGDGNICQPRAMSCCPPSTYGSFCLVAGFSRGGAMKCPLCKEIT